MSDDGPDLATVIALLDDDCARTILAATSREPLSAAELDERCDASLSTVTRRLDDLAAAGLVDDRTRPRPDGHHDTVYAAGLERFEVTLRDGEFGFELDAAADLGDAGADRGAPAADDSAAGEGDRDPADELKDLWEKL